MLPSLFINHGSPFMALEESAYTSFLAETGKRFTPKAIIIFSAHWEEQVTTISFAEGPLGTIYDFSGFPNQLYQLTYPASGSPELALQLEGLFQQRGIATRRNNSRGLDHGSWIFLRHMYPEAKIPIVTVSINPFLPAVDQYKIGEALQGIGEQNILVIGSGTTVHNFNELKLKQKDAAPWAVEFDNWLEEKIVNRDLESLLQYDQLAPHALRAVPRAEHFVPLFVAMGSSSKKEEPKVLYRGYEFGSFSHICFEF